MRHGCSVWISGRISFLFLLGLVLTGCTTTTRTVHIENGFDAAALQDGGVAVVAIVRAKQRDYRDAPPIADAVREQFQKRWPKLNVLSVHAVKKILGHTVHDAVTLSFHETGSLSAQELEALKPLREKVRFALLLEVWQDDVSHTTAWELVPVMSYVTDPETGQSSWETTYESQLVDQVQRSLKAAFTLYDLDTGKPAWIVEKSLSSTRDWPSSAPPASQVIAQIMKDVFRELSKKRAS